MNPENMREEAVTPVMSSLALAEEQLKLGRTLLANRELQAAAEACRRAVALAPLNPDCHLELARVMQKRHCFQEAAESYQKAIQLDNTNINGYIGLGVMMHKLGRLPEAIKAYVAALRLKPESALACTNLGVVCQDMGDWKLAEELLRRAITLAPKMVSALNNLGAFYSKQERIEEALACFRSVLRLQPDHAGAHFNIGHLSEKMGDLVTAERCYQQALAYKPASGTLQFYLGVLHLLQGRFSPGWQEYESRWDSRHMRNEKRNFPQPLWRGEELHSETILLHAEQGLGDTMQFIRYAPLVAGRGGRVVLEVQPGLRRLAETVAGVAEVVAQGEPLPAFTWQCPLLSLPLAFHSDLESIPASIPYLHAPSEAVEAWSRRLAGPELRVGISWAGNPRHTREKQRTVPVALLAELAKIPGTRLYSLQKGPVTAQLSELPDPTAITDLSAEQSDFSDTAAIVANLDLVISIDTSVAHLTGAMGKPLWVLLHESPDWRWLTERTDSPWYPSARLFRRQSGENWEAVLQRLRPEMEKLAQEKAGSEPSK